MEKNERLHSLDAVRAFALLAGIVLQRPCHSFCRYRRTMCHKAQRWAWSSF